MTYARVLRTVLPLQHAFGGIEDPMPVCIIDHVIKVINTLLFNEIAKNIDVPIRLRIRSKNVTVRNNDDFVGVPYPGILAKFAFKDPNRARPADVVGHQDVGLDPYIISGLDSALTASPGQYLLCKRHKTTGYRNRNLNSIRMQGKVWAACRGRELNRAEVSRQLISGMNRIEDGKRTRTMADRASLLRVSPH